MKAVRVKRLEELIASKGRLNLVVHAFCAKNVNKDDRAIQCDYFQLFVHETCANISDAYYDSLKDSAQLCFCPIYLPTAKKFLQLKKRSNDLENYVKKMESNLVSKMNEIQQVVIDFTTKNSKLSPSPPFINTDWIVSVGKNNIEADLKNDCCPAQLFY
uniref:Uncharacterized protein n=1 Tax=Romanomermis culicivorax TaxID=13658 RepID=A0A915KRU4_ROMCU